MANRVTEPNPYALLALGAMQIIAIGISMQNWGSLNRELKLRHVAFLIAGFSSLAQLTQSFEATLAFGIISGIASLVWFFYMVWHPAYRGPVRD